MGREIERAWSARTLRREPSTAHDPSSDVERSRKSNYRLKKKKTVGGPPKGEVASGDDDPGRRFPGCEFDCTAARARGLLKKRAQPSAVGPAIFVAASG